MSYKVVTEPCQSLRHSSSVEDRKRPEPSLERSAKKRKAGEKDGYDWVFPKSPGVWVAGILVPRTPFEDDRLCNEGGGGWAKIALNLHRPEALKALKK